MQASSGALPAARPSQAVFQFGDFGLEALPAQSQFFTEQPSRPESQGLGLPDSLDSAASSQTQVGLSVGPQLVSNQCRQTPAACLPARLCVTVFEASL